MAIVTGNGTHLLLEGIGVWLDPDDNTVRLLSRDPDLSAGVLDVPIPRGGSADNQLRELLRAYGVTAPRSRERSRSSSSPLVFMHVHPGTTSAGASLTIDLRNEEHLVIQGALGAGRNQLVEAMLVELLTGGGRDVTVQVVGRGPLTTPVKVTARGHVPQHRAETAHATMLDVLRELDAREDAMAGAGVEDIRDGYGRSPGTPKRLIVAIDNAEASLEEWIAQVGVEQATFDLDRLLTGGPAVGIHLMFVRTSPTDGDVLAHLSSITLGDDGTAVYNDGLSEQQFTPTRAARR